MNQSKYNDAQKAYAAGDYRAAFKGFIDSVERDRPDNGLACHMAGNCALRLRKYDDAVTAYRRALLDETYDQVGALRCNLARALAAQGEYSAAIKEYEASLEDPYYSARHKAYSGLGTALLKTGRVKDAAFAFRSAAAEKGNPDPGKALLNLGICFMAMGRPNDAAEAYRAAIGIDTYSGKGKALANLGQAYVAAGRMREAVSAFDKSIHYFEQQLSPAAQRDFEAARLAAGLSVEAPVVHGAVISDEPASPPPVATQEDLPADTVDDTVVERVEVLPVAVTDEPQVVPPAVDPSLTGGIPVTAKTDFFTATDDDLRRKDRELRKEQRRSTHLVFKIAIGVLVAVVLLAGVAAGGYLMGYGVPSQEQTVRELLAAHSSGEDVDGYWVAAPGVDIIRTMMAVPPSSNVSFDSIEKGAVESTAIISITMENDAVMRYSVLFSREGAGWKIANIETYFASTYAE